MNSKFTVLIKCNKENHCMTEWHYKNTKHEWILDIQFSIVINNVVYDFLLQLILIKYI